jgi:ribosomal protein S5
MVSAYRRRINRDEFDYPGREDRLSQGPFEIKDHFMLLILDKDSTTLITKLNRIKHFRYLVFMGNANGVISYGRGKGNDFELALRNALHNCKRNLIAIKQDRLHSFPQDIWARFQNYQMNF